MLLAAPAPAQTPSDSAPYPEDNQSFERKRPPEQPEWSVGRPSTSRELEEDMAPRNLPVIVVPQEIPSPSETAIVATEEEQGAVLPEEDSATSEALETPVTTLGAEVKEALPAGPKQEYFATSVLHGLNKVTARVSEIEAPSGEVVHFGNLEIIARGCWKTTRETGAAEEAALLEVWELKPKEAPSPIFSGWMFASSPGLSGVEHPVYDVTVARCVVEENPKN